MQFANPVFLSTGMVYQYSGTLFSGIIVRIQLFVAACPESTWSRKSEFKAGCVDIESRPSFRQKPKPDLREELLTQV